MPLHYYLGIDVGGTKTQALIADDTGMVIGRGKCGAGNHEIVGYDGLKAALATVTDQALAEAGILRDQVAGAGFGIAGYDWPSELAPTLEAIAVLGLSCPLKAVNDTVIGLVAGAEAGWGVAIVAGTGSNCWGRDSHGREGRVTGNGGQFGEYGGAGEIVGKALHAVAYEVFKRGPETALTQAFVQACGARNAGDLIEGLVLGWYDLDAKLAPLVFQVARDGDSIARQVITWSGNELGETAVGVIHQLAIEQQDFEVVLVGSVWDGGSLIIEPARQAIWQVAPHARFNRLNVPPVVGAVLLGMESAGLEIPILRPALLRNYQGVKP
jgi:N-acetylglucosamine kinase-like BadF-type ATPase